MNIEFHDLHPTFEDLHTAVTHGLQQSPKQLHPKFFYDEVGSQLFDQICAQPEYYIPTVEQQIYERYADEIIAQLGAAGPIIEPGAGSSKKIRFLLNRMQPAMYVPMDISAEHLRVSANRLAADYPQLHIHAVCVDHTKPYNLPSSIPNQNRVFFYPGSSLGNFTPTEAINFLQDLRQKAGDNGKLLIGVDTKKPTPILNRAYNDAAGMTAAFNLNVLNRIQTDLDTDLNPASFQHHAFYNESLGRIEMHLISPQPQTVRVNGNTFELSAGESIHTENSYKYTVAEFHALAQQAGWLAQQTWQDDDEYFSIHLLSAN